MFPISLQTLDQKIKRIAWNFFVILVFEKQAKNLFFYYKIQITHKI